MSENQIHTHSFVSYFVAVSMLYRAAMANFWQARAPQWRAATAFYSAKSKQGLGLGGLASRGGPALQVFTLQGGAL